MKKIILALVMAILVAAPAYAQFINGGFESGDWTGWTKNGGFWYGGIGSYSYSGDPGKSAIVPSGNDPIVAAGGGSLNQVYGGSYSARVNDGDAYYTGWGGYHFSTITQSVVWNDPHIYFAWAAVLQEPGHPHNYEPHFWLKLTDDTAGATLYEVLYAADTIPAGLLHDIYVGGWDHWKYTDWQIVDLDTSSIVGLNHTLTLTLLASDCGYGGHSGYVYLDGFGAAPPPPGPIAEPATFLLAGAGFVGLGFVRKRFKK